MLLAGGLQSSPLDLPTLSLVAVCIAGLLGLFLIIDWLQQRNVRALAWWGSAYLIGASAMALGTMPAPIIKLPAAVPGALTFLACGMVWNGVRLFQGRRVLPFATFIGAALWLGLAQIPGMLDGGNGDDGDSAPAVPFVRRAPDARGGHVEIVAVEVSGDEIGEHKQEIYVFCLRISVDREGKARGMSVGS